ncbi:hypothetical protein D3C74_36710 [compost metagenome]
MPFTHEPAIVPLNKSFQFWLSDFGKACASLMMNKAVATHQQSAALQPGPEAKVIILVMPCTVSLIKVTNAVQQLSAEEHTESYQPPDLTPARCITDIVAYSVAHELFHGGRPAIDLLYAAHIVRHWAYDTYVRCAMQGGT